MTDDEIPSSDTNGTDVGLVKFHDRKFDAPFAFELGGVIPSLNIRYETYGKLNAAADNAILVCHALTGDHHVAGKHNDTDRKPGWWNAFVGAGRPLDTEKFFVIGANCLGGCQGTTGPNSVNPATGATYNCDFPQMTLRDMVRAQHLLVQHLGIKKLHAVIGGSLGGMHALLWGIEYPDTVKNIIALACSASQSAQAIAFNEVGRSAILSDPNWQNGNYSSEKNPAAGLSVARMMAHITYLSERALERKFGREKTANGTAVSPEKNDTFAPEFQVESYLRHQGKSFVNRFDANSYLYITKATDRFDLAEKTPLPVSFAPMQARTLVVGFSSDWLYPPARNRAIVDALWQAGKSATYAEIDTDAGHDAFLLPSVPLFKTLKNFLQ